MSEARKNVLLILVDQMRYDCVGINGNSVIQTPHLDYLGSDGINFDSAYSACPVCIPARRTLMTGKRPSSHGVFMNYQTRLEGPTLPSVLKDAGYQTHLCGKLHLWPQRKLYGFCSTDWADSPKAGSVPDDYQHFLIREGITFPGASSAHGLDLNSFPARPFHLEERYHFSNWVTDRALTFLERRDTTSPYFLNVSYFHPHHPMTPPLFYYDRYINTELPSPLKAEWSRPSASESSGKPVNAWHPDYSDAVQKQMTAAYYGCINHIDDQIGRLLQAVDMENTIILFTSDHGEMLGDHNWLRKRTPYEGSSHIPMLIHLPEDIGISQRKSVDTAVELMDVMPTLLDILDIEAPEGIDGLSLRSVMDGNELSREYIHGECAEIPGMNSGVQFLTDGKWKFIYFPGNGEIQLFNLENDPGETTDLSENDEYQSRIKLFKEMLIVELDGREDGFVIDGNLSCTEEPSSYYLKQYKNDDPSALII